MNRSEGTTLELKREYSDDIKKCVIAFANTNGGTLYIGVDDNGNAVGLKNLDGTMLQLTNAIRDSIKPDVTLFMTCQIEEMEGLNVIKVTVQKGTASPYYLSGKGIRPEGVFVRQGASSVPATEAAILKMIRESDGEKYENVRSLNQELTFADAEKEFKSRGIPFEAKQKKTLKLMNSDGIYTNLGLLLSDQCVHTVKAAVFQGTNQTIFKNRREFSGSLFTQLADVYEFISRYNQTRAEIHGLYRYDNQDYPEDAIRETILNALVHRDYSIGGSSILAGVFDDRIEIVSNGGLPSGMEADDLEMGISVCRNENLANVFYRLSLIEAYGTGIQKIMKSYEKYTVKPKIQVSSNAFKITLPNTNIEAEKKADEEKKLKAKLNVAESVAVYRICDEAEESKSISSLKVHEKTVLEMFEKQELITRKEAEKALSLSQPMMAIILRKMVENKKLRKVGSGNKTKYERVNDVL
ncbi:RNA-binding domain-containing protein [Methanolapillus millepedarum]|uniref:Schlafen AlbA-2 domain-containing protein n=1 Tax=Methanolapillus millepedarum TaxID=3028296 RepID=A0AA96V4J5_9EURY|nr:hypothetical protein MsAc7_16550 [Methanosarcinaceae archaeon Ac7]